MKQSISALKFYTTMVKARPLGPALANIFLGLYKQLHFEDAWGFVNKFSWPKEFSSKQAF